MANLFSSSCLIGSPMAAVKPFAYSCDLNPPMTISVHGKVRCFCVVGNDGSLAQAANGGAARIQIKCSFTNKVYEDRTKGIACYIDETGEVVCEGYDEGPRTDTQCHFAHPRDGDVRIDVIDLLERSWLQFANDSRCTTELKYRKDDFLN